MFINIKLRIKTRSAVSNSMIVSLIVLTIVAPPYTISIYDDEIGAPVMIYYLIHTVTFFYLFIMLVGFTIHDTQIGKMNV